MQLNNKITHLLFELSELESAANCRYLIGDGDLLRNNLLKLFRATRSKQSHDLIIKIMNEAGYPWFEKMAREGASLELGFVSLKHISSFAPQELATLSEYEFLSLLPVNELVH